MTAPVLHAEGEGEPLLLLHPLVVDRRVWDGTADELPGFRVLTYDFPGHGETPPPSRPTSIEEHADQLAGMIDAQGLSGVHVAGVSLGGLVALVLAATRPDLVASLAVVDAVATYPEPVRQQWRDRQVSAREQGMEHLVEPTLALWFTAQAREQGHPAVEQVRSAVLAMDPEGYARTCESLETVDLTALVPRISAPTLVVCGEDDAPPFVAAAPAFAETIPGARLVWLAPARHAGVLEQREQFLTALREHLSAAVRS